MLLRFSVSNFLSIRDEQELSMMASGAIKDDDRCLMGTPAVRNEKVLPAAVIYGANASGKSNVVAALRFMRRMVLESHNKLEPGAGVPRTAFRLAPECRGKDSSFDLEFVAGGVRYQYGFTANDERFTGEWLYSWPSGVRRELFSREGQKLEFGRTLKGENQVIANLTRPNSLFVSAAAQNNHEILAVVVGFIDSMLFAMDFTIDRDWAIRLTDAAGIDARGVQLLKSLDPAIAGFRIEEKDIGRNRTGISVFKKAAQLGHITSGGAEEYFDLDSESTGTLRLLVLFKTIFAALDNGATAIIDELDSSLHTRACEMLIQLFNSPETNPKGAQLIATTHDTNLLNAELLRRDQIWFTQKDKSGATHLYPLTDIRTRKGDNIEKGYLQGRFGAIPFAGSISNLLKTG